MYGVFVNYIRVVVSRKFISSIEVESQCLFDVDVLATGGRDSIINIYDRRYTKKRK